jgi:hypothetical protein
LDYDSELGLFLDALAAEEQRLNFARQMVFIGVGDQGSRLILDLHGSSSQALPEAEFLVVESSGETGRGTTAEPAQARAVDHALPRLSRHLLPAFPGRQVGSFGLGERLAADDANLDDRLLRSGIRPPSNTQTVFIVSALGGGTGSGVAPHIVRRAKALNPHSRTIAVAMMPSADEPHSAHFNAFCSLSRLLGTDSDPLADMILVADHDRLTGIRGVGAGGEEIAREALLSQMLAALTGAASAGASTEADPSYLAKMSSSIGVQVFVPCVAIGRSLEIFGTIDKILDSALASPLAPIDTEAIMLSYLIVHVPDRLAPSLHEKTLRGQLNKWNSHRFPRLKGSVLQLCHIPRTSDRVDLFLLLGGCKMAVTASRAEQGFTGFKSVVGRKSWEQEFGVDSNAVLEIENVVRGYDTKLDQMTD